MGAKAPFGSLHCSGAAMLAGMARSYTTPVGRSYSWLSRNSTTRRGR